MSQELQGIGILMRSYRFGERDFITHWFCESHGLQKAFLKRPRRKGQLDEGALDLYCISSLEFKYSKNGGDLHVLQSLETLKRFTQFRVDYKRLLISSYLGSLIEYWVEYNQPEPELYDLFTRALYYLNEKTPEWKAVTYFEKELSRILGYGNSPSSLTRLYLSSKKIRELRERVKNSLM